MIRDDHRKVQQLFQQFQSADGRTKKEIAHKAIMELEVHAILEEEIFYPALQKAAEEDTMAEAEEEHHVAEMLMKELMTERLDDTHFEAKFMVLAENVKHHIQEEESELLPKASELGQQRLTQLGQEMETRKQDLLKKLNGKPAKSTDELRKKRTTTTRSRTTAASGGRRTGTGSRKTTTAGTRSRATAGSGSRSRR